jgi:hypothetical protein
VKPILQALLLADKVYEDKSTSKKIVAGIFNQMILVGEHAQPKTVTDEFGGIKTIVPAGMHSGSPSAYISVTEVRRPTTLEVRFVFLDEYEALLHGEIEVNAPSPLDTVEIVVPLPPLPCNRPGTYALEVLCDDELLGSHRLRVSTADKE